MDKLKYYLGTGLKFDVIDPKFETGDYELSSIDLLGYESLTGINVKQQSAELFHFEDVQFKMRPLSSLVKEITVEGYNDGKPFVPLKELHRLSELNHFSKDKEWMHRIFVDTVISCEFHKYDGSVFSADYAQLKYTVSTNLGELIYSFGYNATMNRFEARNETHKQPHGVAYQFDMFELLFRWHFWLFDQSEFGKSLIEIKE